MFTEPYDMVRVMIDGEDIRITTLTKDELRWENEGYEDFVDAVMASIESNLMYDDSDTSGGLKVYYVPRRRVTVNGVSLA